MSTPREGSYLGKREKARAERERERQRAVLKQMEGQGALLTLRTATRLQGRKKEGTEIPM